MDVEADGMISGVYPADSVVLAFVLELVGKKEERIYLFSAGVTL